MTTTATQIDNRDIKQLKKDIAKLQKKVRAAVKRHEKLQARIAKLQASGRIIWMSKDAEIVAGDGCWYVQAESLNTNEDAPGNWYYILSFDDVHGYDCTCESVKPCKHITKLSESFRGVETESASTLVEVKVGTTTIVATRDNIDNALAHHAWTQEMAAHIAQCDAEHKAEQEKRTQAALSSNRGFSLMRR